MEMIWDLEDSVALSAVMNAPMSSLEQWPASTFPSSQMYTCCFVHDSCQ